MSICGLTPMAIVFEDELQAPFAGNEDDSTKRLSRMGVMDDNDNICESSIAVLAATFASNFIDRVLEYCEYETETLDSFIAASKKLFDEKEITGLYFYVVLCCGMVEYPVPKEVICMARRHDVLLAYLQKFINSMQSYAIEKY